jgi:PKD-like domain
MNINKLLLKWTAMLLILFCSSTAFAQNPYANTGDHQVCINNTEPYGVELHVGSTYAWTVTPLAGGNGTITAGATPNLITVTWTSLGTATMQVTETNAAGCVGDPVTIIVTVNPKPILAITNPTAVCAPGTVDITAAAITVGSSGGGTLTYWTNAAATIPYTTPTAATAGTYYIKATTAAGCFDIKSVVVNVNPLPSLVVTNPPAVCAPSTVDLTTAAVTTGSTAGLTFTYWTNAAATTAYASPTTATAGTYYIKGTTAAGCLDIKPVVVTINPLLTPTINCGASTTNSVSFTWAAVGAATGYNISYTINGGAANNIGAIGNVLTYTVNSLAGGDNVAITVTPSGAGCFALATKTCTALACTPPTASISYGTPFCSALTAAQAVTLTGTGTFTGGTYTSTAGLSINATTGAITPSTSTAGPYTVTYTIAASGGCPAVTATTSVTITAQVTPSFAAVASICNGAALSALPTTSTNGVTGTWSPALDNTTTTLYTFTLTVGLCASTTTLTITVNPILTPTINCGASTTSTVSFTWAAVGAASGYNVSYTINGGAVNNIGAIGNVLTYAVNSLAGGDNVAITVTPTGVGCFAAATKTCTALACTPPTASIAYATPFCIATTGQQAVTLTGTGAYTGGTYTSSPAGLSLNATTGAITANTSTANLYTVTYTIAASGGCPAVTATTSVVITSQLVPTFTAVAPIYSGAPLAALPTTSLNGVTGSWSPALSNTVSNTYTFTPTAGQCASTTTLAITVNPLPTPVVTGPSPVCQTIGTNYSTYSTPNVAGHTYNWTVTGGTIIIGQGTNSITVNWTAVGAGNVSVTETITATTCNASANKAVTVNPKPITTPISHN